jgi:hypothetical protein
MTDDYGGPIPPIQDAVTPDVPDPIEEWTPPTPKVDEMPSWARELKAQQEEIAARLAKAQPEDDSWRYDNEELAKRQDARLRQMEEKLSGQLAQIAAPVVIEGVVNYVGKGLSDQAQDFIRKQMKGLHPDAISGLMNNPASVELLRNAAENVHRKSGSTPMPKSEPVQNQRSNKPGLTGDMEAEAQKMFRSLGKVPGFTIEMARDAVKAATGDA